MKVGSWWLLPLALGLLASCSGEKDLVGGGEQKTAAILSFDVTPTKVSAGGQVQLSWRTAHTLRLELSQDGTELSLGDAPFAEGAVSATVEARSTFELVAFGPDAIPVRKSVTVEVEEEGPTIVRFEAADTSPAREGDMRLLRWEVEDADEVTISNLAGFEQRYIGESAGKAEAPAPVSAQGTFEITAVRGDRSASEQLTIEVIKKPTLGSFVASQEELTVDASGEATVTLSWTGVERAEALVIESDTLDPIVIDPDRFDAGSETVTITQDTTFTLVASNEEGQEEESVSVRLFSLPVIDAFTVTPWYVSAGETVDLSWATTGAARVAIRQNGVEIPGEFPATGTHTMVVMLNSTLELVAYNEIGGSSFESRFITVGKPVIDSFQATPSIGWLGGSVELGWETLGSSELEVIFGGETVCSTIVRAEVQKGSCTTPPFDTEGVHTFTLLIRSALGEEVTMATTVGIWSGPTIESFTAEPAILTAGEELTLRWLVGPDPDGVEPTVSIAGSLCPCPITAPGTFVLTVPSDGDFEFTLTASTSSGGSNPATAHAQVKAYAEPEVILTTIPEVFDPDLDDDVTLSWTSQGADQSLILYTLDEKGSNPVELRPVAAEERAAGSLVVPTPTRNTSWRMVATNGAGKSAQDEATLTVLGPEIVSFIGTPPAYPGAPPPPALAVVGGDRVHLEWTTKRATSARLDFLGSIEVIEDANPFVDVSAMGGTRLPLQANGTARSAGDEGSAVLNFPEGFTFPFGGEARTAIVAHANGIASFDLVGALREISPGPTDPVIHFSIFGDNLVSEDAAGNVWWLQGEDAGKKYLILQWKGIEGWSTSRSTADLNFELVLWETGDFEYRYGTMKSATVQGKADGNAAVMGVQSPGARPWSEWLASSGMGTGPGFPGGLSERGFTFRVPSTLAIQGQHDWSPRSAAAVTSRTATLTVKGPTGEASQDLVVEVHPRAFVRGTATASVAREENATISWTTTNATAVRVVDALGVTRCTAQPVQVFAGSCNVSEGVVGTHTYRVVATGALGHEVSKALDVRVSSTEFRIFSFDFLDPSSGEVLSEAIYGAPVRLRWSTNGGDELEITANGIPLPLPDGFSLESDTFDLASAKEDTTFVLTLRSAVDGTLEATRTLVIRTFSWEPQLSATRVAPGTPVTLSMPVTSHTAGTPSFNATLPLQESTAAGKLFADLAIAENPDHLLIGANDDHSVKDLSFQDFTFPYMGQSYGSVKVATNGFLSFDAALTMAYDGNVAIPTTEVARRKMHLMPFWDDLKTLTNGRVHAAKVNDSYVIQWTKVSAQGATAALEYDLNFMVVLHRDGSFEYRYGQMNPPSGTIASCTPNTCVNEANGSSATIGYQNIEGTRGSQLHFGGATSALTNPAFPNGLSNRSFRYDPPVANQIVTLVPTGLHTFDVCGTLGGFLDCRTFTIDAEFKLASFQAASSFIPWGGSVALSWQSQNADKLTLKANGTVIATEATVGRDDGSITVSPTQTTEYVLELRNDFLGRSIASTKTVVVEQFSFDASVDQSNIDPGEKVTLSWDVKKLSGGGFALTTPMVDVSSSSTFFDISTHTDVVELQEANVHNTITDHSFEGGFSFPFLGKSYGSIRVASDGYLSFATGTTSTGANQMLPSVATSSMGVHLAPFWDDLSNRAGGKVLAAMVGNQYFIQWSHVSLLSSSDFNFHDLNFQVVLSADGTFEYRYGLMEGLVGGTSTACFPNTCVNEANGSSATIGYQDLSGRAGDLLHFGGVANSPSNSPFPGTLQNRSFRFSPGAAKGSVDVRPTDSKNYQVCAIAEGFLECSDLVPVLAEWGPLSFAPDSPAIELGLPVNLSWTTKGADGITIVGNPVAGGAAVNVPVLPGQVDAGTAVDTIMEPIVYTLEVRSLGRVKTMKTTVLLRTLRVDLKAGPLVITPGQQVDVTWDLGWEPWRGDPLVAMSLIEVPATGADAYAALDISENEDKVELFGEGSDNQVTFHSFLGGFDFPYYGTDRTGLTIGVNGYISFDTISDNSQNVSIPDTAANVRKIHMAPFWANLHTRVNGRIYAAPVGNDTYVIQWSHVSVVPGSDLTHEYDLNFQLVLRSSGEFEFRYGTMKAPNPPFVDIWNPCYPESCVWEAMGSLATVGYQDPTGAMGGLLHFGKVGGYPGASNNVPFARGFTDRTFRALVSPKGQLTLNPATDTPIQVCGILMGYKECQDTLVLVATPGDLQISELKVDPAAPASQWFEVHNLRDVPYDLEGMTIRSGVNSHVIQTPAKTLPLPAGGHVVLAATNTPGGFTPAYAYGEGLPFGDAGSVSIELGGITLASAGWDPSWPFPAGGTLMVDDSRAELGKVSRPLPDWCPSATGTPGSGEGCHYVLERRAQVPLIDISTTGTAIERFNWLNAVGQVPDGIGFEMPFYDGTVTDLWGSTHGFISFGPLNDPAGRNRRLGEFAAPYTGVVAPFWDELSQDGSARNNGYWQRLRVLGQQVTIVQWVYLRVASGGTPASISFQVQLWESGDIVFGYLDIAENSTPLNYGGTASIGIEDIAGAHGYQYSYAKPYAVSKGQAILYRKK